MFLLQRCANHERTGWSGNPVAVDNLRAIADGLASLGLWIGVVFTDSWRDVPALCGLRRARLGSLPGTFAGVVCLGREAEHAVHLPGPSARSLWHRLPWIILACPSLMQVGGPRPRQAL